MMSIEGLNITVKKVEHNNEVMIVENHETFVILASIGSDYWIIQHYNNQNSLKKVINILQKELKVKVYKAKEKR